MVCSTISLHMQQAAFPLLLIRPKVSEGRKFATKLDRSSSQYNHHSLVNAHLSHTLLLPDGIEQ